MKTLRVLAAVLAMFIVSCGQVDKKTEEPAPITNSTVANTTPVANAGPDQNVTTGTLVTLDGSGSADADGDVLTYSWSITSKPTGSAAALSSATAVNSTFTADLDGSYVLSLVVNDGTVNSAADTVTVTAATANSAPVANAGPDQNVTTGSVVTLDGSGSADADGDVLTYSWSITSKPTGSAAALTGSTTVNPTFTADLDGSYVISLTVNDGTVDSAADTVTITASTGNSAPVANAGADQNVTTGSLVALDGSGSSDTDGDTITYSWSFTSNPTGSAAALTGSTTVNPTFTADLGGSYVISLTVNDGTVSSAADTVTITALTPLPDTGQTTSYTDTWGEDSDYLINPPSYTDNGDGTVTDNVTGLMWQQGEGGSMTWTDAGTYCDGFSLGDYTDWRLPNVKELESIKDSGTYNPAINSIYFPNTDSSYYWSSTTDASDTSSAWYVDFGHGSVDNGNKTTGYDEWTPPPYVRCVRGEQYTSQSFTDNGDSTVTDNVTDLMWQQGEGGSMTWESALGYCEGLSLAGHTDWRLPNRRELLSIVDYTGYGPAIDTTDFPNTYSSYYWSSTTHAYYTSFAWYVDFSNGGVSYSNKTNTFYVRCVRGQ